MRTQGRPRVFLVDDNVGLRATLLDLLTDAGVEVIGEAGDGAEAIRRIPPAAVDLPLVVLMDVRLPGTVNGIGATRLVTDCCVNVRVLVFTAFPGFGIEQAARQAGAAGLLTKGCPAEAILAAVSRAWRELVPVAG